MVKTHQIQVVEQRQTSEIHKRILEEVTEFADIHIDDYTGQHIQESEKDWATILVARCKP